MRYSIDTSALIHAKNYPYRQTMFPCFWRKMDELIEARVLAASDDVKEEINFIDDDLSRWVKQRSGLFVPPERAVQERTNEILASFSDLVDPDDARTNADASVIALAMVNNCAVVAQEKGGSKKKPKIPYVCEQYRVTYMDLYEFVAEQDWVFD